MQSIQSLSIQGFRGYSPDLHQKIDFMKPLTLIWGKNGSGKTTIIECLKFITTGALPPFCQKGKSFVMDPKIAQRQTVIGEIRLKFRTFNGRLVVAKRKVSLTHTNKTSKFESLQQVLKTKGQKGQELTINHQCAQIQKQVPQFLGISKPILENIVFCHQDQSLWPFADNNTLKNIFDQLLQTTQFTKLMQILWQQHKQQTNQLKQLKVRLEYQKASHKKIITSHAKGLDQLKKLAEQFESLSTMKQKLKYMELSLTENKQTVDRRQKIIYQKGSIESTIKSCELYMKSFQEKMSQIQTEYRKKSMKNQSQNLSQKGQIKIQLLKDIDQARLVLEQKKDQLKAMKEKYMSLSQQYQTMRAFQQLSKREQQIKTQVKRVKQIFPDLKNTKTLNDEQFLFKLQLKVKQLKQMQVNIQMIKLKIKNTSLPNLKSNLFTQKEIEKFKSERDKIQNQIKQYSVDILNTYKLQHKQISSISAQKLNDLDNPQQQLKQVLAVIQSKQIELKHYKNQPKLQRSIEEQKSLQQKIVQFNYAGIQHPTKMLTLCTQHKKCHLCLHQLSNKEIDQMKVRIQGTIKRTQQVIFKLQKQKKVEKQKREPSSNNIDPQQMIIKLQQDIKNLETKKQILLNKYNKFIQYKKVKDQDDLNRILQKQLKKCNLTVKVLQKLSNIRKKQDQIYINMSIQNFQQLSSKYQIAIEKYLHLKQKLITFEHIQRQNTEISQKRQLKKQQLLELSKSVEQNQDKVKFLEIAKNICNKLESLLKMKKTKQTKSKQQVESNSQFNSVEQAEYQCNQLKSNIMEQQFLLQKYQLQMKYTITHQQWTIKKQDHQKIMVQLQKLDSQLQSSNKSLQQYNNLKIHFEKENIKMKLRLQAIQTTLNMPYQKEYYSSLIRKQALEQSLRDIDATYYALEDSINQFHSQKMEEINKIIYQIWREIYHGQDIQYIQIQAQAELDNKSKRKKKNYQYRILMKKHLNHSKSEQKVEMKGRCSMGQKVLASIVIRLALAQVFTSNTRILALDEPTTNLDKEHIKNLAESLAKLIELSGGKNLELMIISHDIDFIKMLQGYSEDYYEVSRDQNQFSVINKRSMKELLFNS